MSFNIALSGVAAAQKDLDTTANNIANVNTVGFKESRAEFGDVFASSLLGGGRTKVGDGVVTQEVAQQFSQGSLQFTNTALDLAITGNGFFVTVPDISSQDFTYTRAGQFKLDEDNFVVNSQGDNLLGFPVNSDGTSSSIALSTAEPVQIPDSSGNPSATTEVDLRMNLPAGDPALDPDDFNPNDTTTYNASTSITIYDSLGESHIQTFYFIKDENAASNEWLVVTSVDGEFYDYTNPDGTVPADPTIPNDGPVAGVDQNYVGFGQSLTGPGGATGTTGVWATRLVFDSSGDFTQVQAANGSSLPTGTAGDILLPTTVALTGLTSGADTAQTLAINFNLDTNGIGDNEPTQFASSFEVTSLEQDGLPVGRLTGIDIGPDGLVRATFSNGTSEPISRIALARFSNEQGLTQNGNASWKESILSGEALAGEATTGTFGDINSSALEQSNVNLTTELIDMIIAQRNFQANSRALEINNALNQTILGIR
ncbi:flagellar hook protein FlgE [Planctobacterium marinum]|uniref:flagellar hook protein FlgE n=1 Tax=Planctobacterium marinum TaxID=1631968 RepID=UPI001E5B4141|nr:flagellar hook protein FlgE [Planctobacterium marinum]MCC2606281.1 flagellar hook protein FlgE [Planctobacterium marinum]